MSRREKMEADGEDVVLPECQAPFIVAQLQEIGIVATGMGGPIGFREIEAWQNCTGVRIPPWRAKMLVDLSREYVSFSTKAQKADCPAPWSDEAKTVDRRATIARALRVEFKALMMQK